MSSGFENTESARNGSSAPTPHPEINPWIIAIAVMLGTFMEVLDTTVVNVALPHIAGNLSATVDETTWVLTSYLVSNAIVLPMPVALQSLWAQAHSAGLGIRLHGVIARLRTCP